VILRGLKTKCLECRESSTGKCELHRRVGEVKKLKPEQQLPEETTARIKAALERVQDKSTVILALMPSSKPGKPPYPIVLGTNNTVWCKCDGFKFRSDCRHMKRFRKECVAQKFQ
jgi:hypothetical protein